MTTREAIDLWTALIPLIGTQVVLLVVAAIHAWASANRGRESREQNREILQQVAEIKGNVEAQGVGRVMPGEKECP